MLTLSSIASSTTRTGSISPAIACAARAPIRHPRIDRCATECKKLSASKAPDPGRHHVGTPGDIISECPGDFVGIRRQHVVNEASIGIDQDRPWRFVAVVWDDLTLIGGWDRRLPIGRIRQLLLIPRSEIWVRYRSERCLHASAEQQSQPSRYDYDDLHDANPLVLGTRTGRPSDAPIPLCLCKTPAFAIPLPAQSPGGMAPDYLSPRPVEWFKCNR